MKNTGITISKMIYNKRWERMVHDHLRLSNIHNVISVVVIQHCDRLLFILVVTAFFIPKEDDAPDPTDPAGGCIGGELNV